MIIFKADVVYIGYFAVEETPSSLSVNTILFQNDGQYRMFAKTVGILRVC